MQTKIERRKLSANELFNQFLILDSNEARATWVNTRNLSPTLIELIIFLALDKGYSDVVPYFITKDLNQKRLDKIFILACERGQVALIHYLIANNKVSSGEYNHGLCVAAQNGYLNIVKYLIEQVKADPTAFENFAICMAAENDHLNVVQYLVKNTEANPAAQGNYAIDAALENGHHKMALYLASIPAVQHTMNSTIQKEVGKIREVVKAEYQLRLNKLTHNYGTFFLPSTAASMLDVDVKNVIGVLGNELVLEELDLPHGVLESI